MGCWWPAARLGALSVTAHEWDILKEVAMIFINSSIVWPQINNREGTQLHPSTDNWIEDLSSMALPIRQHQASPSVSLIKESEVTQSCLTLCNPMDCCLPGSSIHGIFEARYWRALPIPSLRDLPNPGIEPGSPKLQAEALPSEPQGSPASYPSPSQATQTENHNHRKLINRITWTTALSNSMKL